MKHKARITSMWNNGVSMCGDSKSHEVPVKNQCGRRAAGFTMAELILAIAIIIILFGVAFVALLQIQKDMKQTEMDGTAKEIYVAAQNHLFLAESQGLLDSDKINKRGTLEGSWKDTDDGAIRYFVYNPNGPANQDNPDVSTNQDNPDVSTSVLNLMLPFGSIDEKVRTGGSYVIRYHLSSATVLDVFYIDNNDSIFTKDDYELLIGDAASDNGGYRGAANKSRRQDYKGQIIGWYGGDGANLDLRLNRPKIEVRNGDTLSINVSNLTSIYNQVETYNNEHAESPATLSVTLVIQGNDSGAQTADLTKFKKTVNSTANSFEFILDDITQPGGRFAEYVTSQNSHEFIPGEDLRIYALVSCDVAGIAPARSSTTTTNSLFAIGRSSNTNSSNYTATIRNYRHLENLSSEVSGFNIDATYSVTAQQMNDLSWDDFMSGTDYSIYYTTGYRNQKLLGPQAVPSTTTPGGKKSFIPIIGDYKLQYDGRGHYLSGLSISDVSEKAAGLFTSVVKQGSSIENLEIVDATVTATNEAECAGVLAGKITKDVKVSNVLVRDRESRGYVASVTAANGVVGGLVGIVENATVSNSAAAVIVSGSKAVGGLVGSANNATITNSYSGGHTTGGAYGDAANVTSSGGNVGGFVGMLSNTQVSNCYSTCSVKGLTAGGFVGEAINNSTTTNCYSTGKVSGNTDSATIGAFAGSAKGLSLTGRYLETVNPEVPSVGNGNGDLLSAADDNTASYNDLAGSLPAHPYDKTAVSYYAGTGGEGANLSQAYSGIYPFKNISELIKTVDSSVTPTGLLVKHLLTHYGDWPVLETLVINRTS